MSFPVETKQRISTDTDLGHLFDALANNEGFITKFIDNADTHRVGRKTVKIEYCFKTALAQNAGTTVQFYLVTADDNTTLQHVDAGFAFNAAAAVEWNAGHNPTASAMRDSVRFVYAQPVRGTASVTYKGSFEIAIPAARHWAIYVFNETGAALSGTAGDHYLRYLYASDYIDISRVNG